MCVYLTQWSTSIVSSKIRKQHKIINDSQILKNSNFVSVGTSPIFVLEGKGKKRKKLIN